MVPSRLAAIAIFLCSHAAAQVRTGTARIANPFDFPNTVFLTQPPGESHRLYIANQAGPIAILKDGVKQQTPFLDLSNLVWFYDEAGLLCVTFHPQFQSNGFLYVFYAALGSNPGVHIVRYSTNPASPDVADPSSATPIYFIPRTASYHVRGWMGFGPDGYLYISSGNGAGDSTLLTNAGGKMLRIDIDHDDFPADPSRNYAIPPTDPLAGSTTALPEIWAYGLRNPWRHSFDRLTGDLWISDVGGSPAGEVNFQPAGLNALRHYGYPCMDGTNCYPGAGCTCNDPAFTLPIYFNPTTGAMLGGYVYRGTAIPSLQGTYFCGDIANKFWSFRFDGTTLTELVDRTAELGLQAPGGTVSFGEDSAGELYICKRNYGIFKIVRPCPVNCDNAPDLTANDFQCFLNKFAARDPAANCDGSTQPPVFTAADFACFLSLFAAGCS